jgi:protocatechuate 3,4-dioxygenase beta subunit
MRICLVLAFAAALQGAVIRGSVVENQTGHFLARAVVGLEPVAGSAGPHLSVRTNLSGFFEFVNLPAGTYLVTAARRAFAPVQYGQKHWRASGVPIVIAENDSSFLNIRLPRLGAIAGTLLDENDVGLPDHDVAIYTDARPPMLLARARTDDRGMYRFFGLDPGAYFVRTLTKSDEEAAYLPTFYKDAAILDQAIPVDVSLDQQVDNVNIRPTLGRLFTVAGRAISPTRDAVTVSMVSDMGTETADMDSNGNFHFNPAAPGQYELQAASTNGRFNTATYQPLSLDRDQPNLSLPLSNYPTIQFAFEDTKGVPIDGRQFQVLLRHKDLSGAGKPETMRGVAGRTGVLPGRYDVALGPAPAWYVVSVSGPRPEGLEQGRADGWNEIVLPPNSANTLKFVLSASPATLHGVVRDTGGAPVVGIPVFLEAYDLERRKRVKDFQILRTDMNGGYRFTGLAPGSYRLLATFDYRTPDAQVMELPVVKTAKMDEGRDAIQDLDQYVVR